MTSYHVEIIRKDGTKIKTEDHGEKDDVISSINTFLFIKIGDIIIDTSEISYVEFKEMTSEEGLEEEKDEPHSKRVRVLKLDGEFVDFYADLVAHEKSIFNELRNCGDESKESALVVKESYSNFGLNELDYYEDVKDGNIDYFGEFHGKRVRVLREDGVKVDYTATLYHDDEMFYSVNQPSKKQLPPRGVYLLKEDSVKFGPNERDYYIEI